MNCEKCRWQRFEPIADRNDKKYLHSANGVLLYQGRYICLMGGCNGSMYDPKDGLILPPAGIHYVGTVGANPEIRVLYDNDREDGYWEEDE